MASPYSGEAYCTRCKEKRTFDGDVRTANGVEVARGKCPVCQTTVTRILSRS